MTTYRMGHTPAPAPPKPPPTVRPGWKMPEPPAPGLIACAHLVGPDDGWDLYWAHDDIDYDYAEDEDGSPFAAILWPFGDNDHAGPAHMEALGFRNAC